MGDIIFCQKTPARKRENEREREASPLFFEPPPEIDQLNGSILDILASKHEYFFSCFYRFIFVLMIERKVQFVHVSTHDSKEGKGGVSKLMMVTVFINKVSDLFSIVFGANI